MTLQIPATCGSIQRFRSYRTRANEELPRKAAAVYGLLSGSAASPDQHGYGNDSVQNGPFGEPAGSLSQLHL
jgi:hypothetical protein